MKKLNVFVKYILLFVVCFFMLGGTVQAYIGYDSYTYSNKDGSIMPAPDAYIPHKMIYGSTLNISAFESLEDVFVDENGQVYLLDSGGDRIIVLNKDYTRLKEISAPKEQSFKGAQGLFVTHDEIYIADKENQNILVLGLDGQVKTVFKAPKSDILPDDFLFQPTKLVVDGEKMMYIISEGTYEGILTMDSTGQFSGFIGANPVKVTPWEIFWKRIATRAQKDAMLQFVPVDHSSLAISEDNFIYCTSKTAQDGKSVKLLSPGGNDIIKDMSEVPLVGDPAHYWFGNLKGSTVFSDVAYYKNGIYACLDTTRGKIFCYNENGYLLYVFGAIGPSDGTFKSPSALTYHDDNIIVLDKERGSVTVFEPTRYAVLINQATQLQKDLYFDKAAEKWEQVLLINENYELGHIETGKIAMNTNENKKAMNKFFDGGSKPLYSKALEGYRTDWIYSNITNVIIGVVGFVLLLSVFAVVKKVRKKPIVTVTVPDSVKSPFNTLIHPFEGFWEVKSQKKGSIKSVLVLIGLLLITSTLRVYNTGYIISNVTIEDFTVIQLIAVIVLVYFVFCVANWSLTTLMDGEGRFKEIMIVTAYATLPITLINLPLALLSNVLIIDEIAFYTFFNFVAVLWVVALILVGCMTVHDYTMGKTIMVILLTLLAMVVIAVLAVLFLNLIQQVYVFVLSIIREIRFRI